MATRLTLVPPRSNEPSAAELAAALDELLAELTDPDATLKRFDAYDALVAEADRAAREAVVDLETAVADLKFGSDFPSGPRQGGRLPGIPSLFLVPAGDPLVKEFLNDRRDAAARDGVQRRDSMAVFDGDHGRGAHDPDAYGRAILSFLAGPCGLPAVRTLSPAKAATGAAANAANVAAASSSASSSRAPAFASPPFGDNVEAEAVAPLSPRPLTPPSIALAEGSAADAETPRSAADDYEDDADDAAARAAAAADGARLRPLLDHDDAPTTDAPSSTAPGGAAARATAAAAALSSSPGGVLFAPAKLTSPSRLSPAALSRDLPPVTPRGRKPPPLF